MSSFADAARDCGDEHSHNGTSLGSVAVDPTPEAFRPRGRALQRDHDYKRNGTADVFCTSDALANWRRLVVTGRRTRDEWAHVVRELINAPRFRKADVIVPVQDQLNTHTPTSRYEAFAPRGKAARGPA